MLLLGPLMTSRELASHKILMEEDHVPSIGASKAVKPHNERSREKGSAQAEFIYAISNSPWVSLVQVVLKKGGMIMVQNEKDELLSTRTVTG